MVTLKKTATIKYVLSPYHLRNHEIPSVKFTKPFTNGKNVICVALKIMHKTGIEKSKQQQTPH